MLKWLRENPHIKHNFTQEYGAKFSKLKNKGKK